VSFDDGFLGVANESASVDGSLEKRVFRFDINSPGYDKSKYPTIAQVRKYLPDVSDGGENAYFKEPLSVVTCMRDETSPARLIGHRLEHMEEEFL
jgi:hypothetical protein